MKTNICYLWNYHESFLVYRDCREDNVRHESKLYQSDEDIIHLASYLSKKKIQTIEHARRYLNNRSKAFHFPDSKMFRFLKSYDSNGHAVWTPVGN